jgi:hypothetical protein
MTDDELRKRALPILRGGRVTVLHARGMTATVDSSRPGVAPYVIDRDANGRWTCSCQRTVDAPQCAHITAVRMVTDHGSPS